MTSKLCGSCRCGRVQFEMQEDPLFVHACHCLHCKRKTGSSFGLTCIVLEEDIDITRGELAAHAESPRTLAFACNECDAVIYRTHSAFNATALLHAGSLEDLRFLNIGAHIWVKRKDPWLRLPEHIPQFEEGYDDRVGVWPEASIERLEKGVQGAG